MADNTTKLTVKKPDEKAPATQTSWHPFESLRREVDRLFEDFDRDFWRPSARRSLFDSNPFWRRELSWAASPAVDIVEKDASFELTADMPGLDEKDIEVKVASGTLTIRGEKTAEKEDKRKDYYLQERHFGAFERSFRIPDGVDADKIEAQFKKGVLTVSLPKRAEAQKPAKKIDIKAA